MSHDKGLIENVKTEPSETEKDIDQLSNTQATNTQENSAELTNSPLNTNATNIKHGADQFKPNTTVSAIVHHQGKFLLVEEIENNNHVYNQPAGHLEKSENLISAIEREVLEETGLSLTPEYLSGIYYFYRPDLQLYFLRFCFVIELDHYLIGKPQDSEILATHWFSLEQIKEKQAQLRSAMVLECIEDYLSGNKIPLSHIKSNL